MSSRWFVPETTGGQERRAFAFSAKKDWRAKVRSDVKNIVGTNRGYPRIYFVTNQFVPAKDSAAVQDSLKESCGVPVTILDHTWILEKVFEGDSLDIAIEVLGVGRTSEHEVRELGPKDYERSLELDNLEKAIVDGSKYASMPLALAEDCHRAALLARGLGRPRQEVDGRFMRAIRLAQEHELTKQELAVTYDWAWTSYFWFDDPVTLNNLYDGVERLALNTEDSNDIERLTNLRSLLRMSVHTGSLAPDAAVVSHQVV